MGSNSPPIGTSDRAALLTTTRSYGKSVPGFHCPPTSTVFATLGNGSPVHSMCPTIVSRLVAWIAATIASGLTSSVRWSTSAATSNSACANPIGCVHWFPVDSVYAAPRSAADSSVRDDENGWVGVHQTSVDKPSPSGPSASTDDGNRSAFPTDAAFGTNPCWFACVQKFVKSGGIGTPVRISAPASV